MTRTFRMTNVLTLLAFLLMMTAPLAAQQQGTGPTTPPTPQVQIDPYVVGQARPPAVEGSKLIEITLEKAYELALERNLELKAARMNPQMVDYQLQGARATFLPQVTGSYSYNNSQQPSNNTLEGVANITNLSQNFNSGMTQSLPWFGSRYSVTFSNGRQSTNNVTARTNPNFSSNLNLTFNMPLLNGFKIDNNRNTLRTLPIQRQVADIELLSTIESTKNSVRQAYWNLRSAIEQIEINRRAVDIAKKSHDDALLKVEIGTMAPIDTAQFEVQLAQAEQSYLASQIAWRTAELNLKRLLVSGTDDELYLMTINPTDKVALSVASVDIQAAVTKALAERTDIVVSRRNVDVSRLNLEISRSALRPDLNFNAGYRVAGQGGPERLSNGTIIPGGYLDALRAVYGFDLPTWNFGFNFSYPLGMRSAKATYARNVLSLDQSLARIKAQELTISTEVINAGLAVENTYKLYQASVKSREAAEKNANAAQVRFDNGMLTNFEVVTIQNQLTSARLTELTRLIAYMNAIAEFDRVQKVGR